MPSGKKWSSVWFRRPAVRARHLSDSEPVVCGGCQFECQFERGGGTDKVEHDGAAVEQDGGVGRELNGVDVRAVVADVAAIVDVVVLVDVADTLHPVPRLVDPLGVGVVAGVAGQAGGDVEEDAVGNGVFVVVAAVGALDLPAHAAVAVGHLPAGHLGVEDGLGEGEPLGLVGGRVREVDLGGEQGGHAPEALVVVAQRGGPVARHVGVDGGLGLEDHGPRGLSVVRVVARVVPVVDEGSPHGAGLPPVVRTARRRPGQDAGRLAGFVSVVVRPEVGGDDLGGRLDGVCGYPMSAAVVSLRPRVRVLTSRIQVDLQPGGLHLDAGGCQEQGAQQRSRLERHCSPFTVCCRLGRDASVVERVGEIGRVSDGGLDGRGGSGRVGSDGSKMVDSGRRRGAAASVGGGQGAECQSEGLAVVWNTTEVARGAGPELPDV